MNIKHLVAAFAILSTTVSVFAQQTEWVDPAAKFASSKTRAEVVAETKQASADRVQVANERYPAQAAHTGKPRSRDDVRAESTKSAKKQHGEINNLYFGG